MQAPNQNDDMLKLVDESDLEQTRVRFEEPISSHSSFLKSQKSDTYNTKPARKSSCSILRNCVGHFVSSLFINPDNRMNLRCCGRKRRYREFLQPSQIQLEYAKSHKSNRESAMTFGERGSQQSRISLAVPSQPMMIKSQTQRFAQTSSPIKQPELRKQQTQEEKYLNNVIAKQQRQIEMLMQKSVSMRSSKGPNKKPLSFRQAVNKVNGQMQYYEGRPKFLPSNEVSQQQNFLNLNSVTEQSLPLAQESQRIDLIQSQRIEEQKFKEMIQAQNQQIIDQQKKMQSKVKADKLFKIPTPNKEIKKNQNYTEVPVNSQIDDVEMQADEEQQLDLDSPIQEPDEDFREENNLPELNQELVKGLMKKQTSSYEDILKGSSTVLKPMAFNIRKSFIFLKKPLKVFSAQEINENWQKFLDEESPKISDGSTEAVFIFRGLSSGDIELIILDKDKTCKTLLTSKEAEWSDCSQDDVDFEPKLRTIFEALNGKKFGNPPKLPLFMQKPQDQQPVENIEVSKISEKHQEIVKCKDPLFAIFVYYRYYIYQGKYKAMLKFNLDHPNYFGRRDQLIEQTNDVNLKRYFACCLLSLIQQ